jgi:hypothetical protein
MTSFKPIAQVSFSLLGLMLLASGCVVEPRGEHDRYYDRGGEPSEGYYDRDHHRYYHEHGWRDCREHDDEHCRG